MGYVEAEGERESQADSTLSAEPDMRLNPRTLRLWPDPNQEMHNQLNHSGAHMKLLRKTFEKFSNQCIFWVLWTLSRYKINSIISFSSHYNKITLLHPNIKIRFYQQYLFEFVRPQWDLFSVAYQTEYLMIQSNWFVLQKNSRRIIISNAKAFCGKDNT